MRESETRLRLVLRTVVLTALWILLPGNPQALLPADPGAPPARGYVPGEILIEMQPEAVPGVRARLRPDGSLPGSRSGIASLDRLAAQAGVAEMRAAVTRPGPSGRLERYFRITFPRGADEPAMARLFAGDPAVRSAQLNYRYEPDLVPDDPLRSQQYSLTITEAYAAWDLFTGSSDGVTIAVIGTGVSTGHPDLAAHIVHGWDFADNDGNPNPVGDQHETQVAGVAAPVTNNGIGVAGLCWDCQIMPLRIAYETIQVAEAIEWAVSHGARVINMSFGNYDINKYGPDTMVEQEVDAAFAAGVVLVASAGNDSIDTPRYPGALTNVIGVAATTAGDQRASFSNFGEWVDVAAPGLAIRTTFFNSYDQFSGTSFSAPYVAGLAGLLLTRNPALTPLDVRLMIEYAAERLPFDRFIGAGRVNVLNSVRLTAPPAVAAVIKSPWNGDTVSFPAAEIRGTALGQSYQLDYRAGTAGAWTPIAAGTQTINGVLGSLDLSSAPVGPLELRLTATGASGSVADIVAVQYLGRQHPGWPLSIPAGAGVYGDPLVADLEGDGYAEVIANGTDGYIHVWGQDGTLRSGWPRVAGSYYSPPAAGDIDGDGLLEIVATSYIPARVYAFHSDGSPVSGFPFDAGDPDPNSTDWFWGGPALANLDGDPELEIVAISTRGFAHVLNAPGATESPGWPRQLVSNVQSTPAVGNVDGLPGNEIVVRQWESLYVISASGTNLPGWPRALPKSHTSPVIGDLEGDGILEIVAAETTGLSVFDPAGNLRFRYSTGGVQGHGWGGIALGDVTGDERLEILFNTDDFSSPSDLLFGVDSAGGPLPGWPVTIPSGPGGAPLVADLNGDLVPEVIQSSRDGLLHILGGSGAPALDPIPAGGEIEATPAVVDLDGDGDFELLSASLDGRIVVHDLAAPSHGAPAEWPQYQFDAARTGRHPSANLTDSDGDGDPDFFDCRPADPAIHRGALDVCNGVDDDCTGAADDGDEDLDGFLRCEDDCDDGLAEVHPAAAQICDGLNNDCLDPAWPAVPAAEDDGDADGHRICGGDCDDTRASVNPGGAQICGDLLNNDCQHPSWPALAGTNEVDDDADGFSECGAPSDCDDTRASVSPGLPEICDSLDNDCSGAADEPFDQDQDGQTTCGADCDDTRASVRTGAPQVCDGRNNDCAAPGWPSLAGTNEADDDGDGFHECGASSDCDDGGALTYPGAPQVCGDGLNNDCADPSWPIDATDSDDDGDGFAECEGDCLDGNSLTYPGAPELCDRFDNDCDGVLPPGEVDGDGDGYIPCENDCDDTLATVFPGGPQICDGLNNNCFLPGWPSLAGTNESDDDGDGTSECGGDCADGNPAIYAGAPQICDGFNNDCAAPGWPSVVGTVDADDDADGFTVCGGDCDPARITVYPGAPQVCGDGLNNDCLDPGWPADTSETDDDGDGQTECALASDCDDTRATVYTFAPQLCGDGLNNDCRHASWPALGGTNEGDDDGDGFTECSTVEDCDDTAATVWAAPGEVPGLAASYVASSGTTMLAWQTASPAGATTVTYDVVRSEVPWDFVNGAFCLETNGTDLTAQDAEQTIPILETYFYLIRPRNGCPGAAGIGPLGHDSSGAEIPGRSCP